MTIRAVTYYEVTCDNEAGCRERPSDDYTAWSDEDVALDEAMDHDWSTDEQGHHWCPYHTPTCPPGQHIRFDEDDRCKRCRMWPDETPNCGKSDRDLFTNRPLHCLLTLGHDGVCVWRYSDEATS